MPALSKEFLDIQVTIECGFTLKCICDMTRTYSLKKWLTISVKWFFFWGGQNVDLKFSLKYIFLRLHHLIPGMPYKLAKSYNFVFSRKILVIPKIEEMGYFLAQNQQF